MIKKISHLLLFYLLTLVAPSTTLAACDPTKSSGPISDICVKTGRASQIGFLDGKGTSVSTIISGFWNTIVNGVVLPLISAIAVIFLIWSGIQYITARGNQDQLKKARQNIINIILAIVLVLSIYTLIGLITGTAEYFANHAQTTK